MEAGVPEPETRAKTAKHSPADGTATAIVVRPVGASDWPAFASLFESPGAPKNCWCMVWRGSAEERRAIAAAVGTAKPERGKPAPASVARRNAMGKRIKGGVPVGLLAYAGEEAVAWCSIAPRPTYRPLGGLPAADDEDP